VRALIQENAQGMKEHAKEMEKIREIQEETARIVK
jgi:hypothetical protein